MTTIALTYPQFVEQFKPLRNGINKQAAYNGTLFMPSGEELAHIQQQPDNRLFVIYMDNGGRIPELVIGSVHTLLHSVDPIGYFIADDDIYQDNFYIVYFDEDDPDNASYAQPVPPTPVTMTYESFVEAYKPIANHLDDNASLDGCMYETYGEEHDYVRTQPSDEIWTYLDGDYGEALIVSGYHFVNRIGYVITEAPCPDHLTITVELDNVWEQAADYIENYLLEGKQDDKAWLIFQCYERGDLASAVIHLLHTSYKGKYDPIRFTNEINNRALEETHG